MIEDNITDITTAPAEQPVPIIDEQTQQEDVAVTPDAPPPVEPEKPAIVLKDIDFFNNNVDWHNSNLAEGDKPLVKYRFAQDIPDEEYNGLKSKVEVGTLNEYNTLSTKYPEYKVGKAEKYEDINDENYTKLHNANKAQSELTQYNEIVRLLPNKRGLTKIKDRKDLTPEIMAKAKSAAVEDLNADMAKRSKKIGVEFKPFESYDAIDLASVDNTYKLSNVKEANESISKLKAVYGGISPEIKKFPEFSSYEDFEKRKGDLVSLEKIASATKSKAEQNKFLEAANNQVASVNKELGANIPMYTDSQTAVSAFKPGKDGTIPFNKKVEEIQTTKGLEDFRNQISSIQPTGGARGDIAATNLATDNSPFNLEQKRKEYLAKYNERANNIAMLSKKTLKTGDNAPIFTDMDVALTSPYIKMAPMRPSPSVDANWLNREGKFGLGAPNIRMDEVSGRPIDPRVDELSELVSKTNKRSNELSVTLKSKVAEYNDYAKEIEGIQKSGVAITPDQKMHLDNLKEDVDNLRLGLDAMSSSAVSKYNNLFSIQKLQGSTAGDIARIAVGIPVEIIKVAIQSLSTMAPYITKDFSQEESADLNKWLDKKASSLIQAISQSSPEHLQSAGTFMKGLEFSGSMLPYVALGEVKLAAGATASEALMLMSSFSSEMEQLNNNPKTETLSQDEKNGIALSHAVVSTAAMSLGLKAGIRGKGNLGMSIENITYNVFKDLPNTMPAVKTALSKILAGAGSFGALNFGSSIAGEGVNKAVNLVKGEELFPTKNVYQVAADALQSGAQGLFDGGFFNGIIGIRAAVKQGAFNKSVFNAVDEMYSNPAAFNVAHNEIRRKLALGEITPKEAASQFKSITVFKDIMSQIPEDLNKNDRRIVTNLLLENKNYEAQMSGLNESFAAQFKKRIENNNKEIEKIAASHIERTLSEKEAPTTEEGKPEAEATPVEPTEEQKAAKGRVDDFVEELATSNPDAHERAKEDPTPVIDELIESSKEKLDAAAPEEKAPIQEEIDRLEGIKKDVELGNEKPVEEPVEKQEAKPLGEVSDSEHSEFIDTGKVDPKRLEDIANKVKNNEPLSDREKDIFTNKTAEVNNLIREQAEPKAEKSDPGGAKFTPELEAQMPQHKPMFSALKKGLAAIKSIMPNIDIRVHDTHESMQKVLDAYEVNGKDGKRRRAENVKGNYGVFKDGSIRIDFNLAAGANRITAAHELGHVILEKAFGDNPKMFDYLKKQVSSLVGETKNKYLLDFIKMYGESKKSNEYLTELAAIMGGGKIEPTVMRKVAAAINKIINKVSLGKFSPFEDIKNSNELVNYFSSLSEALHAGKEIKLNEKYTPKEEPVSEKAANEPGSKPTKTAQQAEKFFTGEEEHPKFKNLTDVAKWLGNWSRKNRIVNVDMSKESDNKIIKSLVEHTKKELEAWETINEGYEGFYDEDIPNALNPELMKWAKKEHGVDLTNDQISLYHILSSFASPSATPVFDSNIGLQIFDRYLKTGEISGYHDTKQATIWEHKPVLNKKGVQVKGKNGKLKTVRYDTKVLKFEDDGVTPVKAQIARAYAMESLDNFKKVVEYFGGDVKKAVNWVESVHSYDELSNVMGTPLKNVYGVNDAGKKVVKDKPLQPHENLSVKHGGFGAFAISGPKLGSYILNRVGEYGTVTKDLWYARTMARLFGEPLINKAGEVLKTPWNITADGIRRRKLADKAWEQVAEDLGTKPAIIQQRVWDFEKRLWQKLGAESSAPGKASEGLLRGIEEVAKPKSKQSLVDDAKMTKDMTEDEKGNYLFYHYSPGKIPNIDPRHFGKNLRTGRDERPGIGVSMYYTRPDRRDVGGSYGYVVRVPKDKVYPFNSDPLNLMDKAKATFEKMYPGQAFDKNKQVAFVSQEAAKAGYDMTVAKWGNDLRAQTTKVMKGETYEKPHPDYHTSTVFNPKLEKYVANENKPKSKQSLVETEQRSRFEKSKIFAGVDKSISDAASSYKKKENLSDQTPDFVLSVSENDGKKIADAYEQMAHDPENPKVKQGFTELIGEIKKQAEELVSMGYKFELAKEGDGYNSDSKKMAKDVIENKRILVDPSSKSYGTKRTFDKDNMGLQDSGYKDANGVPMTNVELIRAVHDLFGHAEFGNGFGAAGEENAWRNHMSMFTPLAQKALTTTTRGQNSWVNFGPEMRNPDGSIKKKGDEGYLSPSERPFAEQKIGFLPDWAMENSYGDRVNVEGREVVPTNKHISEGKEVYEIDDIDAFYDAISAAKSSRGLDGIQVELKDKSKYQEILDKGGRFLITKDGKAGMMIEADGNTGSGFAHKDIPEGQNTLKPLLLTAIKLGARYTDAYDTYLPNYYSKFGFKVLNRIPFNKEFADKGWEKTILSQEPDVVTMYWDGGDRSKIEKNYGSFQKYEKNNGKVINDYDKAIEETKNKSNEIEEFASLVPPKIDKTKAEVPKSKQQLSEKGEKFKKEMQGFFDRNKDTGKEEDVIENAIADAEKKWAQWIRNNQEEYNSAVMGFKEDNGIKIKAAPSQAKISGEKPKKVTVNEYSSLKKQVELEIKAARDATKTVVDAHKAIKELVKGNKDSFTRSDYEKIMDVMSGVKDEKSINKAFDKIVEIEKNSKAGDIKEVSEFKELKGKIRLIYEANKEGKKSVTDPLREIGDKLKEMEGRGKITEKQAKILLDRLANVNTDNPDMVDRYFDYAEKVFKDADYADKLKEARDINNSLKSAIKSDAVPLMLKSLVKKFVGDGSTNTGINPSKVSDIDTHLEHARDVLDAVKSGGLRIKEGDISDNTRHAVDIAKVNDYINKVKQEIEDADAEKISADLGIDMSSESEPTSTQPIEDYIQDRFKGMAESVRNIIRNGVSPIDGAKFDLSPENKNTLSKLVNMNINEVNDIKDRVRILEAMDHLITNGDMGLIPSIMRKHESSKRVDNGIAARIKVTSNGVKLAALEKVFAKIRQAFVSRNSKKDFGMYYSALKHNAARDIDNLIKNYAGFEIFNHGDKQLAKGWSNLHSKETELDTKKYFNKVMQSFHGDINKAVTSSFKITMYLRQLEYESNPGRKDVLSGIGYITETIKDSDLKRTPIQGKALDALKQLVGWDGSGELKANESNFITEDGQIDAKKIYNSFNPAEKAAVNGLRATYNQTTPYLKRVAEIRGKEFAPIENYTTISRSGVRSEHDQFSMSDQEVSATELANERNAFSLGTKAGQIIERDGKHHSINMDPYATANKTIRDVLQDYHLTEPIREMRRMSQGFLDHALIELSKTQKGTPEYKKAKTVALFAEAMREISNEKIENMLSKSYFNQTILSDALDFISRKTITYMLSKPSKAIPEIGSNIGFVTLAYPKEIAVGLAKYAKFSHSKDFGNMLEYVNSTVSDRLFPHGNLHGAIIDPESFDISVTGMQNMAGESQRLATMGYYNSLLPIQKKGAAIAEGMLTAPDLLVMRKLWTGSFDVNFKKMTGKEVDFKKLSTNDIEYYNKYRDAIDKCTDIADRNTVNTGSTKNPFLISPASGSANSSMKIIHSLTNFLTGFNRTEFGVTNNAIQALVHGGKMPRAEAVRLLAGVATRAGLYNAIQKYTLHALGGVSITAAYALYKKTKGDDEEDDLEKALTDGMPPSLETREMAAKRQLQWFKGLNPKLPGVAPDVNVGSYMKTTDTDPYTTSQIEQNASGQESFGTNFLQGVAKGAVQMGVFRNFGNIQNSFLTAPAVEYVNEYMRNKLNENGYGVDKYDKYKNNLVYSKFPDLHNKNWPEQLTEDLLGQYGMVPSVAVGALMTQTRISDMENKRDEALDILDKIKKGEPVKEYTFKDKEDLEKTVSELNIKIKKERINRYEKAAIFSLGLTGALPGARDINKMWETAMKPTVIKFSDWQKLNDRYKDLKSIEGGHNTTIDNPEAPEKRISDTFNK